MIYFDSDYLEGAHPKILEKLVETNFVQDVGYGYDQYTQSAKEKIRLACKNPHAEIHFLVGGTQTNSLVIKSFLNSYEAVLSPDSGHIVDHEAGTIEANGHKVILLKHSHGKIRASQIKTYMQHFLKDPLRNHMVQPGLVYISHPTEFGTLYTKSELENIYRMAHAYDLPVYIDGARLGYGIMSSNTDVDLEVISNNCDAFYIGGTKIGALIGEALIYPRPGQIKQIFTQIKQHGALLAKGRTLGIQFDVLFTDNLYFEISRHAILMAEKLKAGFKDKGYHFYLDSSTNQQFLILDNLKIKKLQKDFSFTLWQPIGVNKWVCRFCTSWATTEDQVNKLLDAI